MNKYKTVDDILRSHKSFEINDELSIMDNGKTIWIIIGLIKTTYYLMTIEFLSSENHKIHHQEKEGIFMKLAEEPLSIEMDEEIRAIIIESKPDIYNIFTTKGLIIIPNVSYEVVKKYRKTVKNYLL